MLSNWLTSYARYLHLGFKSAESLLVWRRVRAAWAILRMRHPLLASRVEMRNYDDVKFMYVPYRFREASADLTCATLVSFTA